MDKHRLIGLFTKPLFLVW